MSKNKKSEIINTALNSIKLAYSSVAFLIDEYDLKELIPVWRGLRNCYQYFSKKSKEIFEQDIKDKFEELLDNMYDLIDQYENNQDE